jgi:hypothetical protein
VVDGQPGGALPCLFRPAAACHSAGRPEYAATAGPARDYVRSNNGLQPGDPRKAAQATLAAHDSDEPPLRLVPGQGATANVRGRPDRLAGELTAWEHAGQATVIGAS